MGDTSVADELLFVVLPYLAIVLLVGVSWYRYARQGFSYSALASQTLENRLHFWGVVPFHWGILVVLAGHLLALVLPGSILWWNTAEVRVILLEATGIAFALLALVGLLVLIARRLARPRPRVVWTHADRLLHLILLVQIVTGILVAVTHGWGSSWFATTATPYLWSLASLQPDVSRIASLGVLIQLHIVTAWLFVAVFPFTRMVHALVAPFPYLWRRPQLVRWWRPTSRVR